MRQKMTKGERLRHFRETRGLNQTQISKALNIPPRNWSRYETDKTSPPQEVLVSLAKIGLDIHWYMTGENEGRLTSQPFDEKILYEKANKSASNALPDLLKKGNGIPLVFEWDKEFEDGIVIPVLGDNPVSAGHGAGIGDDDLPTRYIHAPRELAKYLHLTSLPVKGDSMNPTLSDGDMVVCDGGGWDGDGVYVIKTIEETFVKRVQHTSDGFRIISDNKMYESYTESNEKVAIVGKVRAAVVMMPGKKSGV
jgi:phage repressor protein C with HTH and peptisase S24 domain/DNA-binding XRE family transcriptional regulator